MEILASKEILAEWGAERGFLGGKKKKNQTTPNNRSFPDTMGWEEPTGKQAHPGASWKASWRRQSCQGEKKDPRWKGRALEIKPQEGAGGEPVSRVPLQEQEGTCCHRSEHAWCHVRFWLAQTTVLPCWK